MHRVGALSSSVFMPYRVSWIVLHSVLLYVLTVSSMANPRANCDLSDSEIEKAQELIRVLSSAISPGAQSQPTRSIGSAEPGPSQPGTVTSRGMIYI